MPELADTSVWARKNNPVLRSWFATAITAGEILLCDMVALELLHSASTPVLYQALAQNLTGMPWLHMDHREWERALEVYGLLAAKGNALHRSVKHADLLIAAAAELAGVTLAHYDHDYDTIAGVTGQPVRWVAPRGTLEQPAPGRAMR
ncbi:MAG: PIN domain-containing protein [Dehalococcoidia bacterium]